VTAERTTVNAGLGALVLGLLAAAAPTALGVTGLRAFALQFVGAPVAVAGGLVAWNYLARARTVEALLRGEGVLADWSLAAEDWNAFATAEHEDDGAAARLVLYVIDGCLIVGGALVFLKDQDDGPVALGITLGLIAFFHVLMKLALPGAAHCLVRPGGTARVLVAQDGLLVQNELHAWTAPGVRLERVEVTKRAGRTLLAFTYSLPQRHGGRLRLIANVPVPTEVREEATALAARFTAELDRAS
jgi:hypothetical protein